MPVRLAGSRRENMLALAREGRGDLFWALFRVLWMIEDRGIERHELARASGMSVRTLGRILVGANVTLEALERVDDGVEKLTREREKVDG